MTVCISATAFLPNYR